MELIKNNPFRIAGILSNASTRELERQKAKMNAYVKVGKEIKSDYDFTIMGEISRIDIELVKKAFSDIEQNHDRVNYALFWFLNVNAFDNTAIEYLKSGNAEKAIEIWAKITDDRDVNLKNFSAFNNLGTLKFLSQSEDDIKEGIEAKIKLIESDHFEDFVHAVADETYTIDNERQIEKFVDELIVYLNNHYPREKTIELFDNCNGSAKNYLLRKFTEDPIYKIESQIESSKTKRKDNKIDLNRIGLNLYLDCKDDLSFLKSILGKNDLKYIMIADNLAKEIMQCGVDYFNYWKETKDSSREVSTLFEYAKSFAVGNQTIERIESNLEGLVEFKNKETNLLLFILEQISDSYKESGYNYKTGMTMSVNESKVINLMKEHLTIQNVFKIANSNNLETIQKFFSLIDHVFSFIGKNNYTYSIAASFKDSLPNGSAFKIKAENLSVKIKPTVGSIASKVVEKADDASGGWFSEIGLRILAIGSFIFIIWLLSLIFD